MQILSWSSTGMMWQAYVRNRVDPVGLGELEPAKSSPIAMLARSTTIEPESPGWPNDFRPHTSPRRLVVDLESKSISMMFSTNVGNSSSSKWNSPETSVFRTIPVVQPVERPTLNTRGTAGPALAMSSGAAGSCGLGSMMPRSMMTLRTPVIAPVWNSFAGSPGSLSEMMRGS